MAYEQVTIDQFLERFPRFESADHYLIEMLLTEAGTQIDNTWLEQDYQNAILYWTAHMLQTEINAAGAGGANGVIQSESFGPMSRTYAVNASTVSDEALETTIYGRRFKALRKANFPGIAVA